MNQPIKTTIATLTLTLALFTGNVATAAQTTITSDYVAVVNATNGLNLRGLDCKVIKVLSHKTVLITRLTAFEGENTFKNAPETKTCNINGKDVKMKLVSDMLTAPSSAEGYVAEAFLSPVITSKNIFAPDYGSKPFQANATSGLNIRDHNCKKVGTVPNNYSFNETLGGIGGSVVVCEVNNTYYDMTYVPYKGEWRMAATAFLE